MILTKKKLRVWEESAFITFTQEQEKLILEQFGTEPDDEHVWSLQDIVQQVRKICLKHPAKNKGAR